MSKVYVVTEGSQDVEILQRLLPAELVRTVSFVVGDGAPEARSLAVSLLVARPNPVVLVVDGNTDHPATLTERRELLEFLMGRAALPERYCVLVAPPEIEIVLLHDRPTLEKLVGREISDAEWEAAQHQPKTAIQRWAAAAASPPSQFVADLCQQLTQRPDSHPLVQTLLEFLERHAAAPASPT